MAKLKEIQPIIHEILLTNEEARLDDYILTYEVLKRYISDDTPLYKLFTNHVFYGLPSLTSIPRIRRLLQTKYPELEPSEEAKAKRKEEIKEYKQYALNFK